MYLLICFLLVAHLFFALSSNLPPSLSHAVTHLPYMIAGMARTVRRKVLLPTLLAFPCRRYGEDGQKTRYFADDDNVDLEVGGCRHANAF